MKTTRSILAILAVGLSSLLMTGHGAEPPQKPKSIMEQKLQSAQKVLEGLAVEDLKMVTTNAEELIRLSKSAEWKVLKTPKFELYSEDFRRHAGTMIEESKKKNLDGAALAYVELTLTCVRCHKHVRDTRMTRLDD